MKLLVLLIVINLPLTIIGCSQGNIDNIISSTSFCDYQSNLVKEQLILESSEEERLNLFKPENNWDKYEEALNTKNSFTNIQKAKIQGCFNVFNNKKMKISQIHTYANKIKYKNDQTSFKNWDALKTYFHQQKLRNKQDFLFQFDKLEKFVENDIFLNLYNYLSYAFGKENVHEWLFMLAFSQKMTEFIAEKKKENNFPLILSGILYYDEKQNHQALLLNNDLFNDQALLNNYKNGYANFKTGMGAIVSLYGEVLEYSLARLPNSINTGILPVKDNDDKYVDAEFMIFLEEWFNFNATKNINEGLLEIVDFNNNKINFNLNKVFDEWLFMQFKNQNDKYLKFQKEELIAILKILLTGNSILRANDTLKVSFSDLFSQWFLMPYYQNELPIKWNILNDFFDYLTNEYWKSVDNFLGVVEFRDFH